MSFISEINCWINSFLSWWRSLKSLPPSSPPSHFFMSAHTCILYSRISRVFSNRNEISLTQLVSEGLIVLWLLYYLLSSRYLAPLNSLKWCVDSENKPREQTPGGIQGSDCAGLETPTWPRLQWRRGVRRGRRTDGCTRSFWSFASVQVRLRFL